MLHKRYGGTPKPVEEAMNARLASVWIVEWVIFLRTKRKERRLGKIWQLYKPKLRVNRLRVIRIHKVCESMRFDSGPEVFVRVNRNYVLTEYVLNENDCNEYYAPTWEVQLCKNTHRSGSVDLMWLRCKIFCCSGSGRCSGEAKFLQPCDPDLRVFWFC